MDFTGPPCFSFTFYKNTIHKDQLPRKVSRPFTAAGVAPMLEVRTAAMLVLLNAENYKKMWGSLYWHTVLNFLKISHLVVMLLEGVESRRTLFAQKAERAGKNREVELQHFSCSYTQHVVRMLK
jgi:hypothetical protein